MLGDFLRSLVDFASYLWPFAIVHQWERGIYFIFGRPKFGLLQPGLYPKIPWFTDVHPIGVTWSYVKTGRLDLVLKDDRILSCDVTAKMRVIDPLRAYLEYHDFEHDAVLMLEAVASETLTEADAERFTAARRGRLLGGSMLKAVQDGASSIGYEVESVQFTTFILNAKTVRLLTENTMHL